MPEPLVLVVEDDEEMRTYVCECLDALPVRVAEAADGQEALDRIRDDLGDDLALVVSDVVMQRLGGRALKTALQADRRWAGLPVLLLTGESVRARDGPVLKKPFNAQRLCDAVRTLLDL